jgi:cytochrome c oxidase subunit II
MWFEATKTGDYQLFCAEYCGTNNSRMIGRIHVMAPVDYESWLSGGASAESMPQAGERLFQRLGCASFHRADGSGRGLSFEGLFGTKVQMENGQEALADEAYLRRCIFNPGANRVAGYPPIMPTFQGLINEEGLLQIIEYIKSRAKQKGTSLP